MKKIKILWFIVLLSGLIVNAQEITYELEEVVITASKEENKSKITSQELAKQKTVDLAETMSDEMVEASLIRKGAFGNEVSIRGFGKANLRTMVDDGIIEGACGSRKDPALSHINVLTIDKIQVRQGPFDVTKPGALGGSINVYTKRPEQGIHSEIVAKGGSFGFMSSGFSVTGGKEKVQALLGYNYAQSGQYKDGDGNKLSSFAPGGRPYNSEGIDMKSFQKHDIWGKLQIKPLDNHTLLLSYSYGAADDIMSPRVGMDMETEKTILANAEYVVNDLGSISDALKFTVYRNSVEHNPYDKYRTLVGPPPFNRHNEVQNTILGGKIENTTTANIARFTYGFDMYLRNWNGVMYNDEAGVAISEELFPDIDLFNAGFYVNVNKTFTSWALDIGLRGDRFETEANKPLPNAESKLGTNTNKQEDFLPSGYISGKYYFSDNTHLFAGIGQSVRMPAGNERYLQPPRGADFSGNPDLKPTKNREADIGFETTVLDRIHLRTKAFYSSLQDYIYQEAAPKTWVNIDAHIYGGDVKAVVDITDHLFVNAGVAYQRGKKDSHPKDNSNENLAEIPPLKTKLALKYNNTRFFGALDWIHSAEAEYVDIDAGEQKLAGWNTLNFKAGIQVWKAAISIGINNILNETYAVANSYEWDVVSGSAATPPIVYEPGRFIYLSMSLKF
jgi:iron complex outermembrane receptor protein